MLFIAAVLAPVAAVAADKELKAEAVLVWGCNESTSPDPAHKPVDAETKKKLKDLPLKWTDPYDRVALYVGQAVFFAFLLTGVTLRERPPDLDTDYSMPFELLWREHLHRNEELEQRVRPKL